MDDKEVHNLLFSAIQHHNDTLLDDLLNGEGSSERFLDLPGNDGNMLLHAAVLENDLRCVECLLKHGANPNVFDTNRARTPLHLAVELSQTDIVKAFLELEHINLDTRDDRNLTCYEIAQFCDNQQLADLIRARHNAIEKLKDDFYSLMNQACSSNDTKLVRELLDRYEKKIVARLPKGWSPTKDKKVFARTSIKELINWSSSSWNDVTLLFKSASKGHTDICRLLIEFGATARRNENTNYSPLYVAAYGGFTETVELLLDSFPSLVRENTIEKWTVLHACCLQGHWETAKLILTYPYPDELKSRFISRSGVYEYHFAFDLNAQDAAGQTVIYLAVSANNEKLLDTLLQFNVRATLLQTSPEKLVAESGESRRLTQSSEKASTNNHQHARIIPDRPKLNNDLTGGFQANSQLDKIIRQLRKVDVVGKDDVTTVDKSLKGGEDNRKYLICPFELDTYCDYNSKTALHLAVSQQYHSIATTLLVNGSNPNLPILSRDTIRSDFTNANMDTGLNWLRSSKSTCLKEASRLNDEVMCDILIRYGANDNQDNLALKVAASNKNNNLISKFLSLKSNVDPEFRINKKCNVEFASRYKQSQKLSKIFQGNVTTTFSSMFPSAPVMIEWQNLKCIKRIDPQWLIDASLMHNKRLKHSTTSLLAITRLDLSANNLKTIHPVIFRLPSLRELNLSNNRLESLFDYNQRGSTEGDVTVPTSKLIESHRVAMKRSKSSNLTSVNLESSNIIDLNEPQEWDLPYLETLDLHDNHIISLPDCLFELPRLSELDVSSNQIRQLPCSMWTAPSLKEVVASGNLLDDLPKIPHSSDNSPGSSSRLEYNDSPTDERSSIASNQSTSHNRCDSSFLSSADSDSGRDQSIHHSLDTSDTRVVQLESSTLQINHLNNWKKKVDLVNNITVFNESSNENLSEQGGARSISKITYLNLSHNSFASIPPVLACIATELTRLNLSYNRITSLSHVSLYPTKLKNIDLSHNQISSWFNSDHQDNSLKRCYVENYGQGSTSSSKLSAHGYGGLLCSHRVHSRLDGLKSINLSYNALKDIQLVSPAELDSSQRSRSPASSSREDFDSNSSIRELLLYPNVTALDIAFNKIQQVPKNIFTLKDLSVLNLSGNLSISSLPAELGLATKLWNLGISGCSLNEPLKSIVESKTYKTMDIIGYLRSILDEAKPYARMKLMLVGLQGIGKTSLLEQMRLEGSSGLRRRAPEHWTKRMGHSSRSNLRNQRGVTLSTVGVDIHDWTFCKRVPRNQPTFGPVSFSTWDFGGQHEFYATHRYFLSRRSMYLVVWRLTDGLSGIQGIQQWLVNIQSRASGSPVIIVGTHEDMVEGGESGEAVKRLQAEVHRQFINISDHDKCGLPRVVDSIVVSTKTKLNIKHLCNRIYDVVFSLRCLGSTERLLEQKIPATYLYLEEIINWIVHDRHQRKREPVLTYDEYKRVTSEQLLSKYHKTFRDLEPLNSREINYNSELQQATRFLHENGILLHYEDANLRDLFFLDPQWLCDILSHVVTIREINPHVKNGLMKIADLGYLFKSVNINLSGGVQSYVVNLLNKFEVALTWNSQYLLIPSLLPTKPDDINEQQDFQVKMAPRMRGRSAVRRFEPNRGAMRSSSIDPLRAKAAVQRAGSDAKSSFEIIQQADKTMYRLVLLRYLPAGFLARLQSGILSDPTYDDICADLYSYFINKSGEENESLSQSLGSRAGWTCWTNGISLTLQNDTTINSRVTNTNTIALPLLTIQELSTMSKDSTIYQREFKVDCAQPNIDSNSSSSSGTDKSNNLVVGSKWCEFDITQYSNIIMVSVPNWKLRVTKEDNSVEFIEPEYQSIAKLLANSIDHIDNLLEDWYPSLGTRFAHTLGGNYLVTRIIPCFSCFSAVHSSKNLGFTSSYDGQRQSRNMTRLTGNRNGNFTISSAIEATELNMSNKTNYANNFNDQSVYCYYVEHCIFLAYNIVSSQLDCSNQRRYSLNPAQTPGFNRGKSNIRNLQCPKHGAISLSSLAPDIVFHDIPDSFRIDTEQVERCKLIGRGTFGFVFKGSLRSTFPLNQLGNSNQEVALKLLQPVDPGPEAEQTDIAAYKSARSNWAREPFHCACKSYCTARHEINILQTLRHPNIVLFIGLCVRPLAIILELATLGCLTDIFKTYKRAGMRIDQYSVQKTILQVAKALEFLHQQRIIYRDLKAENVLVWSFPSPFATQLQNASVELKLADYGISRQALSTGIWKGFAGTINFLAPEILRHNGDEEYTEKVDCFSFGMFMYELLTLRPPFKHNEGTKNHLADGGRPTLTMRDLIYPNYMIDLMSVCWSQEPHHRPTASQIVSIASTPEFMQLLDVVSLDRSQSLEEPSTSCEAIQYADNDECNLDLWLSRRHSNTTEVLSTSIGHWNNYQKISTTRTMRGSDSIITEGLYATCMCTVENRIWLCDSDLVVNAIPLDFSYQEPTTQTNHSFNKSQIQKLTDNPLSISSSSTAQRFTLKLHKTKKVGVIVKQMVHVQSSHCVILLLSDGQIWIQHLDTMTSKQLDDGSIPFKCISVEEFVPSQDSNDHHDQPQQPQQQLVSAKQTYRSFNLYCGQSDGISCLEITDGIVSRQNILPLAGKQVDLSGERILEPSQSTEVSSIVVSKDFLWTAAGCTVHLWSIKEKCVARKLDCWKLVPCSESLESINIENYYQRARSSVVSSLVYLNNQLYLGTSHGCFMVVEADSLKPMIVFRPYESSIRIMVPTIVKRNTTTNLNEEARYLVTIGSGYRDLMRRFVSSLDGSPNDSSTNSDAAILWSANYYSNSLK